MALRPRLSTGLPLSQRFSQVSAPHVCICGHWRSLIPTDTYLRRLVVESKAYSPSYLEGVSVLKDSLVPLSEPR